MLRSQPARSLLIGLTALFAASQTAAWATAAEGWLHWRGPAQTGVSPETGLPDSIDLNGQGHLWEYKIAGRGTPVISDGRVFSLGYEGEGRDLQEVVLCLDERDGRRLWEHRFNDFLTDNIYSRYAIGSPTVDAETGNVYVFSSAGEVTGFTSDGYLLWQRAFGAELGRITFPNGRTGAAVIDEDRVLVHAITAQYGPVNGPARDRFYAFDKHTGETVWICTPGIEPKDSSFSPPFIHRGGDQHLLYAGTGCGNLVCIDARTGDAQWRFPMATGGVNSAVMRRGETIYAIHGKENIDSTVIGRMVAIKSGPRRALGTPEAVLDTKSEVWRNDLDAFTSSPVLVGDRIFQTTATGDLACVDVNTGALLWHEKLAPDQIHASPVFADGKLYVPMNNGSFHIVRPTDSGPERLQTLQLEGSCLGAPAVANGQIYVHTTDRLYCFGDVRKTVDRAAETAAIVRLQVIPADILLRQGQSVPVRVRGLGADGRVVEERVSDVEWTAKGPAQLVFTDTGAIAVAKGGRTGISFLTAKAGSASGEAQVRVVNALPYIEDFEGMPLKETPPSGDGPAFAYPPAAWIGARLKFEVLDLEGEKVLAKTLDNNLFQRATVMIGQPEMSDYTVQVDIRTDGNRRSMSTAGVINQRYMVQLKGNHQEIEVSSNMERIKETVPYSWSPNVWYTLKTHVAVQADGSGVVRAKVWKRADPEPEAWNIEVEHKHAHKNGSPGLFGFSPQSRFRVYMDNLQVIPND